MRTRRHLGSMGAGREKSDGKKIETWYIALKEKASMNKRDFSSDGLAPRAIAGYLRRRLGDCVSDSAAPLKTTKGAHVTH